MRTPRTPESTLAPAALERWESWPLWAIGLSNGLNISLWFVLSMVRVQAPELALRLPPMVNLAMPWLIVVGAVASALSLDGVLIATIAGVRHGRRSQWSYATIAGSGVFSAMIAYAVHSGLLAQWSWLHVAQALVLVLYNLHLAQPKRFTAPAGLASALPGWRLAHTPHSADGSPSALPETPFPLLQLEPAEQRAKIPQQSKLKACKHCGEMVTFAESGAHGLYFKRHGRCVAA